VPRQARTKRRPNSLRIINDAVAALERAESVLRIGALVAEWESLDIKGGIDLHKEVRRFETWLIERALHETGGNRSRAARLLGLNKTTLHEKMKRNGIN
jgi:DNA-binding NtrC family response regulator